MADHSAQFVVVHGPGSHGADFGQVLAVGEYVRAADEGRVRTPHYVAGPFDQRSEAADVNRLHQEGFAIEAQEPEQFRDVLRGALHRDAPSYASQLAESRRGDEQLAAHIEREEQGVALEDDAAKLAAIGKRLVGRGADRDARAVGRFASGVRDGVPQSAREQADVLAVAQRMQRRSDARAGDAVALETRTDRSDLRAIAGRLEARGYGDEAHAIAVRAAARGDGAITPTERDAVRAVAVALREEAERDASDARALSVRGRGRREHVTDRATATFRALVSEGIGDDAAAALSIGGAAGGPDALGPVDYQAVVSRVDGLEDADREERGAAEVAAPSTSLAAALAEVEAAMLDDARALQSTGGRDARARLVRQQEENAALKARLEDLSRAGVERLELERDGTARDRRSTVEAIRAATDRALDGFGTPGAARDRGAERTRSLSL